MSEQIVWSDTGGSVVDGVLLARMLNEQRTWTVVSAGVEKVLCAQDDCDLAARAVVAAVRVMRGE